MIAQDDKERLRPVELDRARINARQRLRCERLLAVEDRLAFDPPINDLARRPPRLLAREQDQLAVRALAMCRHRPADAVPIAARHQNKALACRGVAVIRRVQLSPFGLETEALDRFDPCVKVFALAGLDRLAGSRIDRSPADELPHVFDDHALHAEFGEPRNDVPRIGALLVAGWFASARDAVMRACRRGHEKIEIALGDDQMRPHRCDVLTVMPRFRMIFPVRFDRDPPMVDADKLHFEAKLGQRASAAGRRSARTTQQVSNKHLAAHAA